MQLGSSACIKLEPRSSPLICDSYVAWGCADAPGRAGFRREGLDNPLPVVVEESKVRSPDVDYQK